MTIHRLAACIVAALLTPAALHAQVNVLQNRYDPQRTGANLNETRLTGANVNVTRFGKLYSYPVDGAVYAQPLYISGLTIKGSTRNVLFVATMNDRVYAFDADSASPTPLWTANFTNPPSVTPVPITDIVPANLNVVGNVGIQSTPVIDRTTATMYLVARTKENGNYVQRLHALDITTGSERPGSPVRITGSAAGNALDSTAGPQGRVITFDPKVQLQRAGLALTNGVVLVSWAAHEDITPSHGWIMGFDSSTLARVGIFAVAPDAYLGGVWQGGRAPTIDAAGNVYFATGNGLWDGTRNFGNSLLKFAVSRAGLTLLDYFTPFNEEQLNLSDDDLSGSGFTLLPGTNLLLGGGKEGVLYLLNSANLGRKVADDTQIVQRIAVSGGHVMGGPVFWNSPTAGPLVYNWSEDDVLKAYRLTGGRLATPPYAQGVVMSPGHPGGSLTVSANGSSAGTGVVWASIPTSQDAKHGLKAGILRAFHADTLQEIWTSEQNAARDRVGTIMKFVPPVVANGKVFMPNHNNAVAVYGLLSADFSIGVTPASRVIAPRTSTTFSVSVGAVGGFSGQVALSASGAPSGVTVSFNPQTITGSGTSTMTVAASAAAPTGSFKIAVAGTSGARTRTASVTVSVETAPAGVGAIGIDFVGSGTAAMGVAERAGVVAQAHWNSATGASRGTPLALVDDTGVATAARVTWTANNTWATPIADQAGNPRMMKGYLDTTSTSRTTVTVTGLSSRTYDVYVYADGANGVYSRTAAYSISGPGITAATIKLTDAANTNFTTTFTRASNSNGNYVKFSITGSEFTVTAAPVSGTNSTLRAPVNGIQIVPAAPAPLPPAMAINFVGSSTPAMGAAERAGVVVQANWNNGTGASRATPLALVDGAGAATTARITWTSSNTWATPIADQAGNARMMKGYLDTTSTSKTSVTVTGLPARAYDVYVYVDGANGSYSRTAAYTISGSGITTTTINLTDPANTDFTTTFTRASNSNGNYVRFRINATTFTLMAAPVSGTNATLRAPVNGIQIVPVAP